MRNAWPIVFLHIVALFAGACQSNTAPSPGSQPDPESTPASLHDRPVAYLDAQPVTQDEVYRLIAQAHGGEALTQILLDRAVRERLKQENIELAPAQIESEREQLLATLSADADEAARLLKQLRAGRGLDTKRFDAMLRRNAGLRALVREQVTINNAAIKQAYQLRYGPRYRVRLIVTRQLPELTNARREALQGASFTDLAIEYSTDASASQGGLLSPISPADPTYPKAIRDALPRLKMDNPNTRLSPAIALDTGYALLWLEEVLTPDSPPTLEQTREALEAAVRTDLERIRMRQLARTLIEQTNVVVLDPALEKSWQRQRDSMTAP